MASITCIDDLQRLARRRVPRMFYDYADSGSWTESTYRANHEELAALRLRQRVMVDLSDRSLRREMLGEPCSMPLGLAPVGLAGMQHADGEIHAARAAERFGVPFTLSTMSICSIEDVAAHTDRPFWFQLYVMRDRDFTARLIDRARAAGCPALVLTADLQVLGQRHKDIRNGLTVPPKLSVATVANLASKWRWGAGMLRTRRRTFGNIVGHVREASNLESLSGWVASQFDPALSWDDVRRIRDRWDGKLVIKGIMDPRDAVEAVDAGADAILVSNHGGRQLDGAPAAIRALPGVVAAVGDRAEVYMDGGIRSGQDVLKTLASGARGAFIGRAWVYGLGAMGESGVTSALETIRRELDTTLALCGLRDIDDVDEAILWRD
ncbi:MAG TPA: alpha-hydroxy acid oxidase [Gammaproteobacteria bacterium]|nr:alpha-hydroxy acid oxidase [Gammaproteobacteria bacterium]